MDDLYSLYRYEVPGLQLAKLGCPGERTGTMRNGEKSSYSLGSQLDQAVAFLETHHVVLVTIDIGANNVDGCLSAGGIDETCITNGITAAATDLPVILGTLQASLGVRPRRSNCRDELLRPVPRRVVEGPPFRLSPPLSVSLATYYNGVLGSIYGYFHDPVADVQSAFQTTNFTPVRIIGLPVNVRPFVCSPGCAPRPRWPNIPCQAARLWVDRLRLRAAGRPFVAPTAYTLQRRSAL